VAAMLMTWRYASACRSSRDCKFERSQKIFGDLASYARRMARPLGSKARP
jgi:hypothetical protein